MLGTNHVDTSPIAAAFLGETCSAASSIVVWDPRTRTSVHLKLVTRFRSIQKRTLLPSISLSQGFVQTRYQNLQTPHPRQAAPSPSPPANMSYIPGLTLPSTIFTNAPVSILLPLGLGMGVGLVSQPGSSKPKSTGDRPAREIGSFKATEDRYTKLKTPLPPSSVALRSGLDRAVPVDGIC